MNYKYMLGQPDAVMVTIGRDEHLSFVAQSPERDRVHYPVTVALKGTARAARQRRLNRELPPPALRGIAGVWSSHASLKIQSTAAWAWIRVQS